MPHALRDQLIEPIPLPAADIAQCKTYRDACLLAWDRRTFLEMRKTHLAAMTGIPAPHVTLYFHRSSVDRHGRRRPVLPADFIARVEFALGNTAISQFLEYERATVREDKWEWVALVLCLLAVVPVAGGLLKGVGKLLMRAVEKSEDLVKLCQEIVALVRKAGLGDAVQWFRKLDFTQYQDVVIKAFGTMLDRIGKALNFDLPGDFRTS